MLAALVALGVDSADVLVRDPSRTGGVRATAERLGLTVAVHPLEPGSTALDADLVVSTLPRGAADPLAPRAWRAGQTVLDVVYDPWPTPLATAARRGGARVVSGALMLLHQAAVQVALMTGLDAPVDSMRAALDAAAPDSGL